MTSFGGSVVETLENRFTPAWDRGGKGDGEGTGRDELRSPVLGAPLAERGGRQGIRRT